MLCVMCYVRCDLVSYFYLIFVLVVFVDFEPRHHPVAQFVLGQHAVDRFFDDFPGILFHLLLQGLVPDPTRIAAEIMIGFFLHLAAGYLELIGVDNHREIAPVEVRREINFVFAAQNQSDLGRQPAQGFAFGVELMIFSVNYLGHVGLVNPMLTNVQIGVQILQIRNRRAFVLFVFKFINLSGLYELDHRHPRSVTLSSF